MEYWDSISAENGIAIDSNSVCHLLNAIGGVDQASLANAVLNLVNRHVAMTDCTVMAFEDERNPRIISVSTLAHDQQLIRCVSEYAQQLYKHDRIQLHLKSMLAQQEIGDKTVHRQTMAQIIDSELRRLCIDTLGVVDSMVITIKTGCREWITTSLCRNRKQGLLDRDEIETILQLASLIATSVSRHCSLETEAEGDYQTTMNDGIDQLCSLLTKRERQVILRILDGVTVDQIAAGLGVKPTTVITYRSRAYEKLGISSRRELFSTLLHNHMDFKRWQPADIQESPSHLNGPSYAASTGTDRPYQ